MVISSNNTLPVDPRSTERPQNSPTQTAELVPKDRNGTKQTESTLAMYGLRYDADKTHENVVRRAQSCRCWGSSLRLLKLLPPDVPHNEISNNLCTVTIQVRPKSILVIAAYNIVRRRQPNLHASDPFMFETNGRENNAA